MTPLVVDRQRIRGRGPLAVEGTDTKQAERERKTLGRVQDRVSAMSQSASEWVDRQEPDSSTGVAISAWRHYRSIEGPLQSALLSLYVLVAVLPARLVLEEYLDRHPDALATRIAHHYHLNAPTTSLLHSVLGAGRVHELGSALLA